ncbi:VOC family protein [Parasphingopyxis sp.]|uniref:VOC family protein n=1 Tax=Parasphingopyxis sp. TaxID=1920299 RepID=UPI0026335F12|nr:VOC family protein [Parasphingopyxis sp.]
MGIDFDGGLTCTLGVSDLDRSIDWYFDTLGFTLMYRVDEIGWCELETAVDKVSMGLSQVESVAIGGGVTPTFGTSDIEAAKADLDAKHVKQDGPIQDVPGLVRLLTFYDPDDNPLMLYQDMREAAE